jgi:hypothetical protein
MKKYVVTLSAAERQELAALITAGKGAAAKLAHARVLLKADAAPGGPAWPDATGWAGDSKAVGRTNRRERQVRTCD